MNCKHFSEFISKEIRNRVITGAVRVWGVVGVDDPPHLVLPLTVEPTKPRLCIDARFLNLWMKDMPFSLDKLSEVTRYVYPGSFMTKCDDKSGYDHVMLTESSQSGTVDEYLALLKTPAKGLEKLKMSTLFLIQSRIQFLNG